MPCNCDHLEATAREIELSRVACLLDELDNADEINKDHWRGYHPRVYNKHTSVDGNAMTEALCSRLQKLNVSDYSLEMQMWWRDHMLADTQRVVRELAEEQTGKAREAALAKLTPYERSLLNL